MPGIIDYFLKMYLIFKHICICVCGMCMYTQRPEDVIESHRTRVRGLCELLYVGGENQTVILPTVM